MSGLSGVLDAIVAVVRSVVRRLAGWLNHRTDGKLRPSTVTFISLFAHVPIAWLITDAHIAWAGLLLIIFGLFDALDGELARLQHRASAAGMLLDATTDRMKEVILYVGVAFFFINNGHPQAAVWAVLATGASLLVSYVKAKGETAVATGTSDHTAINHLFAAGIMRYEVRMALLVIGLLSHHVIGAVALISLLSAWTALDRLVKISGSLGHDQN